MEQLPMRGWDLSFDKNNKSQNDVFLYLVLPVDSVYVLQCLIDQWECSQKKEFQRGFSFEFDYKKWNDLPWLCLQAIIRFAIEVFIWRHPHTAKCWTRKKEDILIWWCSVRDPDWRYLKGQQNNCSEERSPQQETMERRRERIVFYVANLCPEDSQLADGDENVHHTLNSLQSRWWFAHHVCGVVPRLGPPQLAYSNLVTSRIFYTFVDNREEFFRSENNVFWQSLGFLSKVGCFSRKNWRFERRVK